MAETDILLTVGLDTRNADKTAEQLQKEVESIFNSRKGQQSAALTSLEAQMKRNYEAAKQFRQSLSDLYAEQDKLSNYNKLLDSSKATEKQLDVLQQKIQELKSSTVNFWGEELTGKELEEWRTQIEATKNQSLESISSRTGWLEQARGELADIKGDPDMAGREAYLERYIAKQEELLKLDKEELKTSEEQLTAYEAAKASLEGLTAEYDGQKVTLKQLEEEYAKTEDSLNGVKTTMQEMKEASPDIENANYQKNLQESINATERSLDSTNDKLKQQIIKHREIDGSVEKVAKTTEKVNVNWGKIGTTIKNINNKINAMFKSMASHFHRTQKDTASTNISFKKLLRTILKYGFGIRSLYVLFNKLRSAVKEGLANYAQYSDSYKQKTDEFKAATLTLKNSFATAFAPIIEIAIPYIKQLIGWMSTLLSYIAQFTSALTGQAKYTKAVEQTADALEAAGKAAEGYLSPIDTINKMNKNDGAGGVAGMFEEAEIDSKIADLADKFKKLISELFAPLKKAWDVFGDYVKRAWKRVVDSVKNLVGDIWRDFKDVWTGSTMQKVFYNIVALLGDIGNLVADIIDKIDEAWNANGKRILEAIANLLEVITRHFRKFVAITREWVKKVNLNPLFEKFAELLEALKPVAESVFGILEDFYEDVLLKFAGWTIEEGLPKLLQVFKDFVEKVDWDKLRSNLDELWQHLEPFMERVGEGLILFIEELADKLANWVNSKSFENLLDTIGKFLDGISAEDVKNGIENFLIFVAAIKGLTLIAGLATTIGKLAELYSTLKEISLLKDLTKTVSVGVKADTASAAAAGSTVASTFVSALLAAVVGFEVGKKLGEIIFPEDKEYYKNFKWFGENGFFQAVADWWDLIFLPYIQKRADELKTNFNNFTDDVKKIFTTFADDFGSIVVNGLNVIVSFLNGDFTNAWNNVKNLAVSCATAIQNAFNNVSDVGAKLPVIGGYFQKRYTWTSGTAGGVHHGFATGGVIPPSAEEHLIKVGDNKTETEIVSPLSTIRQAVSEALMGMGGAGSQPIVIKQYLDGKQVAEAVVSAGRIQQMSTGRNMFELG